MQYAQFADEDSPRARQKKSAAGAQAAPQPPQQKQQQQQVQVLNDREAKAAAERQWLTEAYQDFKDRLTYDYLVAHDITQFEELRKKLQMIAGNSSPASILCWRLSSCVLCPLILPTLYWQTRTVFEVEANHFAFVIERGTGGKRTKIYGPGSHILGYFSQLQGIYSLNGSYPNNIIESEVGDLKLVKVVQGTLAHFDCGGQNIILGPGIHLITEPMVFIKVVKLDSFYIEIGPEKWITVPSGYDGISINRGQIRILEGGKQHHLSHIGDKFVKMVPKTLMTDRVPSDIQSYIEQLEDNNQSSAQKRQQQHQQNQRQSQADKTLYLKTTTSEGASVHLDCMIFWQIVDTDLAARTAIQFLNIEDEYDTRTHSHHQAIKAASENINQLRATVLQIAQSHLTALVGTCSIASRVSLQADIHKKGVPNVFAGEANSARDVKDDNDFLPNKQRLQQQQQPQTNNSAASASAAAAAAAQIDDATAAQQNKNFQILHVLQESCQTLKDHINNDLRKLGVFLSNICIFSVMPSVDIQQELDKQTKAKVDGNTAIIQALASQKSNLIEQQIAQQRAVQTAQYQNDIIKMRAQAEAEAQITRANAEAQAITRVAHARREEAEQLQQMPIAMELARIRAAGEAGEKIFTGGSNNFVYAREPGDVLFQMFSSFRNSQFQAAGQLPPPPASAGADNGKKK